MNIYVLWMNTILNIVLPIILLVVLNILVSTVIVNCELIAHLDVSIIAWLFVLIISVSASFQQREMGKAMY